jgi:hypothetical protein
MLHPGQILRGSLPLLSPIVNICPVYFLSHLRSSATNHTCRACPTSLSFVHWCLMKHTDASHNPQNTSFGGFIPNTKLIQDFRLPPRCYTAYVVADVSVASSRVRQPKKTVCPLKKGSIGCPETSVTKCQVTLRNFSEERIPQRILLPVLTVYLNSVIKKLASINKQSYRQAPQNTRNTNNMSPENKMGNVWSRIEDETKNK